MRVFRTVLALAVSLAIAGSLSAEDQRKGKQPESRPAAGGIQVDELLKGLNLSRAQMMRIQALAKQYAPKFNKLTKKQTNILTVEQKKAVAEAKRKAIKAGKEPHEIEAAIRDAVTLTDEQQKAMDEIEEEMVGLQREMLGKALKCLTPAQREFIRKKLEAQQKRTPDEKKETQ